MSKPRFLQIHSLHGYTSVLLNRDDSGLAKRLLYGNATRTRVSSQCLKRHWRTSDGIHALDNITGVDIGVRSRKVVTERVTDPLKTAYPEVVDIVRDAFHEAVYGKKGIDMKNRQPLLLGEQEIKYLVEKAKEIIEQGEGERAKVESLLKDLLKQFRGNMKAMRENCRLPGGIAAALFGRMVTSDVEANIDACVHVAHSFTVHAEESEMDYFTVVDDLRDREDDAGASHIGETELTSGLFYGYVVIDRKTMLDNLGGDLSLASRVTSRLVKLIATVSPGAKLGPTAPYGYAGWMMIEAGSWQPRSLAEGFRKPCSPSLATAVGRVDRQLSALDHAYETGEERRHLCTEAIEVQACGSKLSLKGLADWAANSLFEVDE